MEATKFTFDATCGLTNAASGRTADISFEADAAGNTAVFFSGVFFDTEKERSEFNTTLGECTVSGAALSCAFGVATEFSVCYGGTVSLSLDGRLILLSLRGKRVLMLCDAVLLPRYRASR